jgi:hypothetical protein
LSDPLLEGKNLDNKNDLKSPNLIDFSESDKKTEKFFLQDNSDEDHVTNQKRSDHMTLKVNSDWLMIYCY